MHIEINPWAVLLVLLIVCNTFLGFSSKRLFRQLFMGLSSLLAAGGVIGLFTVRSALLRALAIRSHFVPELNQTVREQYDTFAKGSLTFLIAVLLVCLLILVMKRQPFSPGVHITVTSICVFAALLILGASIIYTLQIINKVFNTSGYVGDLAVCETLTLYIPVITKRAMSAFLKHNPPTAQ